MKLFRTFLFWLHLAAGCIAGLVIFSMAATGILLAFERQINTWADSPAELRSIDASHAKLSIDAALLSLKNAGQEIPDQLVLHKAPSVPLEARYGREKTLFLSPFTGEVIGQPSEQTRAFFEAVERFHRSLGLGMQSALGRGLTGAGNLVFLGLLLSGLYLWLPKTFSATSLKNRLLFRRGLSGRSREWNWHHVIGISSALPLLFIVVTGVIMSYPWASNLLFTLTGSKPPAFGWRGEGRPHRGGKPAGTDSGQTVQFPPLGQAAATAMSQVPAWRSITIDVPQADDRNVSISVDTSIGGQPEKSSQLTIDRTSGRIVTVKNFSSNNLGSKLRAWARFTHTGEEFGVIGEAIAALASLGAMFLVWTGLSMAVRRIVTMPVRARGESIGSKANASNKPPLAQPVNF